MYNHTYINVNVVTAHSLCLDVKDFLNSYCSFTTDKVQNKLYVHVDILFTYIQTTNTIRLACDEKNARL